MKIQGVVLAGGRSTRFGSDKAHAKIGSISLAQKAINLLKDINLNPLLVSNNDQDFSYLSCPVVVDQIPNQGPLGGLQTALTLTDADAVLVLVCDMPGVTNELLNHLLEEHHFSQLLTHFAFGREMEQPFPGIYDKKLLDLVNQQLNQGRRSMKALSEQVQSKKIVQLDQNFDCFVNVNTQEDWNKKNE